MRKHVLTAQVATEFCLLFFGALAFSPEKLRGQFSLSDVFKGSLELANPVTLPPTYVVIYAFVATFLVVLVFVLSMVWKAAR